MVPDDGAFNRTSNNYRSFVAPAALQAAAAANQVPANAAPAQSGMVNERTFQGSYAWKALPGNHQIWSLKFKRQFFCGTKTTISFDSLEILKEKI